MTGNKNRGGRRSGAGRKHNRIIVHLAPETVIALEAIADTAGETADAFAGRVLNDYVADWRGTALDDTLYSAPLADALIAQLATLDALHQRLHNAWLEAGKPARQDGALHEWELVWARRAQVWQAFLYYVEQEKVKV
jgi:hypothetical protein